MLILWLPLRFNVVDGEAYGRGRVGQFIGDLKSLEALSQALVEGSAAAAKVVFVVSPSSTINPPRWLQLATVQSSLDDPMTSVLSKLVKLLTLRLRLI